MRRLIKNPIKRNGQCPCGSGKKTKRCCIEDIQALQVMSESGMTRDQILVARTLGHLPGQPPVVPQINGDNEPVEEEASE
jgi:hypothetical protein